MIFTVNGKRIRFQQEEEVREGKESKTESDVEWFEKTVSILDEFTPPLMNASFSLEQFVVYDLPISASTCNSVPCSKVEGRAYPVRGCSPKNKNIKTVSTYPPRVV